MDHLERFKEFCKYEKMTGGPDAHLTSAVYMAKGHTFEEQVWRILLYAGFYNPASANAFWRYWSGEEYLALTDRSVERWLEAQWNNKAMALRGSGFVFRKERRTMLSAVRVKEYLDGYKICLEQLPKLKDADPEVIWDFTMNLPHIGRFSGTKLMECWYRLGIINNTTTDIRARGGWAPRIALSLFEKLDYPTKTHDPYSSSKFSINEAELLGRMTHEHVPDITVFELQVMLCNYKQSYETKEQYPGQGLDKDLGCAYMIKDHWGLGDDTEYMRSRKLLCPIWALGELQGWSGLRKDLGRSLSEHGYVWSDFLYDYTKTKDLAEPVRRLS